MIGPQTICVNYYNITLHKGFKGGEITSKRRNEEFQPVTDWRLRFKGATG